MAKKTKKVSAPVVSEPKVAEVAPEKKAFKTLVYDKMPINRYTTFKYGEYIFTFDTKLDPVPVKVPSDVADVLLQMEDKNCRCHNGELKKLFREVE